jgi:hypothetical protein
MGERDHRRRRSLAPYLAGYVLASPPHVWAATFLGLAIILYPLCLIATRPGHALTRHAIAVAQMLTSALLIHISGGRIETHFTYGVRKAAA